MARLACVDVPVAEAAKGTIVRVEQLTRHADTMPSALEQEALDAPLLDCAPRRRVFRLALPSFGLVLALVSSDAVPCQTVESYTFHACVDPLHGDDQLATMLNPQASPPPNQPELAPLAD
jgi:hypothetical protein